MKTKKVSDNMNTICRYKFNFKQH